MKDEKGGKDWLSVILKPLRYTILYRWVQFLPPPPIQDYYSMRTLVLLMKRIVKFLIDKSVTSPFQLPLLSYLGSLRFFHPQFSLKYFKKEDKQLEGNLTTKEAAIE